MHIENIFEIVWHILFGITFGSSLWKQTNCPIIQSQVVGTDIQCLPPEAKFPKFEDALWNCAI